MSSLIFFIINRYLFKILNNNKYTQYLTLTQLQKILYQKLYYTKKKIIITTTI